MNAIAIIENVISGDRVAVRLMLEPTAHIPYAQLLLAGIRGPSTRRTMPDGMEVPAEEYADEAKLFVELRLLNRTVDIELLGLTPQNQLIGKIIHPAGNISELLLAQGLARCDDNHTRFIGPEMSKLRAAEKSAKDKKLKLFKGHVVKAKDSNNSFEAIVQKIIWADLIIVRNKAGQERRLNLSSIRAPK